MKDNDFVAALRGSAPYVHAHNGRVFVIAFGGEAAERPDFDQMIYDIALLHSLGVKLVLIHGARPQVDAELTLRDITSDYVDNLRVTDGPTLDCVMAAVASSCEPNSTNANPRDLLVNLSTMRLQLVTLPAVLNRSSTSPSVVLKDRLPTNSLVAIVCFLSAAIRRSQ